MHILLALFSILSGLSIPALMVSAAFLPQLGLAPLRLGLSPRARVVQVGLAWAGAVGSLIARPAGWGVAALLLAVPFSLLAVNFFPRRLFVALTDPPRSQTGLAPGASVLVVEPPAGAGSTGAPVAYPVELIAPHHIINDIVGGSPVLVAW